MSFQAYKKAIDDLKNTWEKITKDDLDDNFVNTTNELIVQLRQFDDTAFNNLSEKDQNTLKQTAIHCKPFLYIKHHGDWPVDCFSALDNDCKTMTQSPEWSVKNTAKHLGLFILGLTVLVPTVVLYAIPKYAIEQYTKSQKPSSDVPKQKASIENTRAAFNAYRLARATLQKQKKEGEISISLETKIPASRRNVSSIPLHHTTKENKVELTDQHMTCLMPKLEGNTEVLDCLDFLDLNINSQLVINSIIPIQEGITLAIKNSKIEHIIIPIGPTHWRGLYITKPKNKTDPYQIELYDSFGEQSGKKIEQAVLSCLEGCGITKPNLVYTQIEESKRQEDGYSCGDFVCAYSWKKINEFTGTKHPERDALIKALETGNKKGELRDETIAISNEKHSEKTSGSKPVSPSAETTTNTANGYPLTKEAFEQRFCEFYNNNLPINVEAPEPLVYRLCSSNKQGTSSAQLPDVTVTQEKVSALLTGSPDETHMEHLADVMICAALAAGQNLMQLTVNVGSHSNSAMSKMEGILNTKLNALRKAPSVGLSASP